MSSSMSASNSARSRRSSLRSSLELRNGSRSVPRRNLSRAITRKAVIAQGPASPLPITPVRGSGRANGQAPMWKWSL